MRTIANPKGNPQNLTPFSKKTAKERERCVKAAEKSAEVRQSHKSMKEHCDELITEDDRKQIIGKLKTSYLKYGDKKSLELLLKLMGEMNLKIDMDANVHGSLEDALNEL